MGVFPILGLLRRGTVLSLLLRSALLTQPLLCGRSDGNQACNGEVRTHKVSVFLRLALNFINSREFAVFIWFRSDFITVKFVIHILFFILNLFSTLKQRI